MKSLKMICTATLLALAFTIPGQAGEINTPGFKADPPVVTQPTPITEDNVDYVQQFSQDSEFATSELTAILLTLSALF